MEAKTLVWIRSGARCAICNRYLLDDALGEVLPVGENAHIVGREQTAGSPRGLDPLPMVDRDKADNLVLLCREQHKIADRVPQLFTVEELRGIKRRHEARVRHVTELGADRSSTVLRVLGNVRGATAGLDRGLVARAVLRSGRYPYYPLAYHHDGEEIALQTLPDEGSKQYYAASRQAIDDGLRRLSDGLRREQVRHVSLFSFARIPVLVYLGHRLDDAFEVDIYQRHRHSQGWEWDDAQPELAFEVIAPDQVPAGHAAVLVLNLSGTIHDDELPKDVRTLPRYVCRPATGIPHADSFANRRTLSNFEACLREFLASLESSAKHVSTLHVFAAAPVSAAVIIGRVLGPSSPTLLVYDDDDGVRKVAIEIPR